MATLAFRVEPGTVKWNAQEQIIKLTVSFRLTDGTQITNQNLSTPHQTLEGIRIYLEQVALYLEMQHRLDQQEPEVVNILEQYEGKIIDVRNQPPPEEE